MAPLPVASAQPRREAASSRYEPPVTPPQRFPVRELVIAWYEARGYRAELAASVMRPIESILRHREDRSRAYAFVAVKAPLASGQALSLLAKAQSIGVRRLLVAVQAPVAPAPDERLASMGYRQYDEKTIKRELDRIDLRVAAKIIAVAQKRAAVAMARSLSGAPPI
jgi:hypothetical protein